MTPLRRSGFAEGFQAILEHIRGLIYIFICLSWSFDSNPAGTPPCISHPVCIEGLHSGDDSILRRCWAVAALTGGKQCKSLSSCILRYGWNAVDREKKKVSREQKPLRGSNTFTGKILNPSLERWFATTLAVCVCVVQEAYFQLGGSTCGSGWGAGKVGMGGGRYPPTTPIKMSAI